MSTGNLDFEQFRVFLEKACGILLGDNKQYLVSSRLNKLMEIACVPQGRSGDAGGIGGFKTALELLGVIDSATMPAPLALLSDADRDAIRAILVEVDLLS